MGKSEPRWIQANEAQPRKPENKEEEPHAQGSVPDSPSVVLDSSMKSDYSPLQTLWKYWAQDHAANKH